MSRLFNKIPRRLLLAIFMTASARAEDWPTYQHDAQHTGRSSALISPAQTRFAWSSPSGYWQPLVAGNSVYATINGGGSGGPTTFGCFNLSNGSLNWQAQQDLVFPSYPTYAAGLLVYTAINPSRLYVRDATTGALRYSVALPQASNTAPPTVDRNPATGHLTAYLCDYNDITAVRLGQSSGSVLWSNTADVFGGLSAFTIPTIVGRSVIVAPEGQCYAFDLDTGAKNHFHDGRLSGGGGATVVYDDTRQQMYVLGAYDSSHRNVLTAYHYESSGNISELWQKSGAGIQNGNAGALGLDGSIYAAAGTALVKIAPEDGATLLQQTLSTPTANGAGVMLSDSVLWTFTRSDTRALSLDGFGPLAVLPDSRGDANTVYRSPGAVADGYVLLNGANGFDVYIPEPATCMLFGIVWCAALRRRQSFHRKVHGRLTHGQARGSTADGPECQPLPGSRRKGGLTGTGQP